MCVFGRCVWGGMGCGGGGGGVKRGSQTKSG